MLKEDDVLRKLVEQYPYNIEGANAVDWKAVATGTGRTTKQCRERWINVLDPNISHAKWTPEELETLFRSHAELGNRWSAIAARIPGRPETAVKNTFYAAARRVQRRGTADVTSLLAVATEAASASRKSASSVPGSPKISPQPSRPGSSQSSGKRKVAATRASTKARTKSNAGDADDEDNGVSARRRAGKARCTSLESPLDGLESLYERETLRRTTSERGSTEWDTITPRARSSSDSATALLARNPTAAVTLLPSPLRKEGTLPVKEEAFDGAELDLLEAFQSYLSDVDLDDDVASFGDEDDDDPDVDREDDEEFDQKTGCGVELCPPPVQFRGRKARGASAGDVLELGSLPVSPASSVTASKGGSTPVHAAYGAASLLQHKAVDRVRRASLGTEGLVLGLEGGMSTPPSPSNARAPLTGGSRGGPGGDVDITTREGVVSPLTPGSRSRRNSASQPQSPVVCMEGDGTAAGPPFVTVHARGPVIGRRQPPPALPTIHSPPTIPGGDVCGYAEPRHYSPPVTLSDHLHRPKFPDAYCPLPEDAAVFPKHIVTTFGTEPPQAIPPIIPWDTTNIMNELQRLNLYQPTTAAPLARLSATSSSEDPLDVANVDIDAVIGNMY